MKTDRHFYLILAIIAVLLFARSAQTARAEEGFPPRPAARGPFVSVGGLPSHRTLRDLPDLTAATSDAREIPQPDFPQSPSREPLSPPKFRPVGPVAAPLPTALTAPTVTFAGLDFAHWGTGWPPDPNGDVGPDHYVQAVNNSIAVFDKSGHRLKAVTLNDFFDGTGTPCDEYSKGDPIVLYDALADRWLISDMSWAYDTGPYYQCLALSADGDPLGEWYQWGYLVSYARWNDYSKLAVWDDGYYMTANMFQYFDSDELNVRVFAFDRTAMLNGGPLRAVYFDLNDYTATNYYASLLPANLHGPLPPDSAPEYFLAIKDNSNYGPLRLWEFRVDWAHPENSTFTGPTDISVPYFATAISCWGSSGRECIPQPDTTKGLHSIDNKLMMQVQYRNFGSYESLWANHTVDADYNRDIAGIRWYELRDPAGSPSIHQHGTHGGFAGDTTERWMGSLAVDGQGDMALGYSASSGTLYPSIRYAGRLVSDTLNTLRQEMTLTLGSGSQATSYRWGDYTAMTVDPTDDCTFWYTNEYYTETNLVIGNWQTRIGAFRFDECALPVLYGRIYDADDSTAIAGARVEATNHLSATVYLRTADGSGDYRIPVTAGPYTVTARAYGYRPASVTVTAPLTAGADIYLRPADFYTLTGIVTDSVTGYPLAARIYVLGEPVNPPVADGETTADPFTGAYTFTLPAHISYTLIVQSDGYETEQRVIGPLTGDAAQNFA
ncbi:MAG TPA: hypothetical protein ENK17_03530, partial [Anaerolineae bacterium]|nr:hypothetical protein [Anaerolineae bacterium]